MLDATLEDDLLSLCFDGLKKVDGPSKLGDSTTSRCCSTRDGRSARSRGSCWSYTACSSPRITGETARQRGGVARAGVQSPREFRINSDMRKVERLFLDVKELSDSVSRPGLLLNEHCQICEFRQRCHDQAVQERQPFPPSRNG